MWRLIMWLFISCFMVVPWSTLNDGFTLSNVPSRGTTCGIYNVTIRVCWQPWGESGYIISSQIAQIAFLCYCAQEPHRLNFLLTISYSVQRWKIYPNPEEYNYRDDATPPAILDIRRCPIKRYRRNTKELCQFILCLIFHTLWIVQYTWYQRGMFILH